MHNFLKRIIPQILFDKYRNIRIQLSCFKILAVEQGQFRTIRTKTCVDAMNNEIPWYTYPAIAYLEQIDTKEKRIFEWGSGNSSIWWARKSKEVVSAEDDKVWFEKNLNNLLGNQQLLLFEEESNYVSAIAGEDKVYDIIIIDGNYRFKCAQQAISQLSNNGMIILDNSDWFPKTTKFLRDQGLIQVDFSGFGPINSYAWVTSIFLSRQFDFMPAFHVQPTHCVGGLVSNAED